MQNAHVDIVTAVEWRTSSKHGEKKYQLVTWSKDQHLKFWKVDQSLIVRTVFISQTFRRRLIIFSEYVEWSRR